MVCGVGSYSQDSRESPEGLRGLSQHESESMSRLREDGGQVRIDQWYRPRVRKGGMRVRVEKQLALSSFCPPS